MIGRPVSEPRTGFPGVGIAAISRALAVWRFGKESGTIGCLAVEIEARPGRLPMTVDAKPRIAPLEPPYASDVEAALRKWMPPGSPAEPLRLFRTLMLHGDLASRMRPLGAGILGHGEVPPRLREVMIHRTCAVTGAEYEWGVHAVAFGEPLGFSEEQLRSTVHGSWRDDCWDAEEATVFRLADELHRDSTVSDELWAELEARFETAQILELLVTAGWYHAVGYLCNGIGIEPEAWAARFPGNER
jgi:4-carboxymuconolactone decarboxylase